MLYTILPEESIFPNPIEDRATMTEIVSLNGLQVEVLHHTPQYASVVRVISTNPKDFLNPGLQPGSVLHKTFTTMI